MRNRGLHKRLATLEQRLLPPPRVCWNRWMAVLDEPA
jgi:hypothetical protein